MSHGAGEARIQTLIDLQRWDEAIAEAERVLADDPEAIKPRIFLGIALVKRNNSATLDLPRADQIAAGLIADLPESPVGFSILAEVRIAQKSLLPALDALERAIQLDPSSANLHANRAEVRLSLETFGPRRPSSKSRGLLSAQNDAAEAIRLAPDSPTGYLVMAKVHLARQDPGAARRSANRAMQIDPESALGYQILGLAAEQDGNTWAASRHYVDAGRLDPTSSTSTNLLRNLTSAVPLPLWVAAVALLAFAPLAAVVALSIFIVGTIWTRNSSTAITDDARVVLRQDRRLQGSALDRFRRKKR